jgi:hypothetical protein
MPPTNEIGVSAFANRVELQLPGASDGSNGPGIVFYELFRNSAYLGAAGTPSMIDPLTFPPNPFI